MPFKLPNLNDLICCQVTRVEYPSALVQRMIKGINSYKEATEALYIRDKTEGLINFGIPVRFNDQTTHTIKKVRRCIHELNKWMEKEFSGTKHFKKWKDDLKRIFPNLNVFVSHSIKRKKLSFKK